MVGDGRGGHHEPPVVGMGDETGQDPAGRGQLVVDPIVEV
jgi:hypothetical protein